MPSLEVLLLLGDALSTSVAELTDGLRAPARAAGRAEILGLVAQQPGITTRAIVTRSGLPSPYVFEIIRYLASLGELDRHITGWQIGLGASARQRRG
jgi:DNA-binding IclR family transcriptional regulator